MPESTDEKKTWKWLRKVDFKIQTESLLCALQEQALRTNYIKHHIDKSAESPFCRMCEEKGTELSVSARRWHRKNINEGTTMFRGLCIGIYARNTI